MTIIHNPHYANKGGYTVIFNGVKHPKLRGYDLQCMIRNYTFKYGLRLRRIKDVKPYKPTNTALPV